MMASQEGRQTVYKENLKFNFILQKKWLKFYKSHFLSSNPTLKDLQMQNFWRLHVQNCM